jgi:hypothetical protein
MRRGQPPGATSNRIDRFVPQAVRQDRRRGRRVCSRQQFLRSAVRGPDCRARRPGILPPSPWELRRQRLCLPRRWPGWHARLVQSSRRLRGLDRRRFRSATRLALHRLLRSCGRSARSGLLAGSAHDGSGQSRRSCDHRCEFLYAGRSSDPPADSGRSATRHAGEHRIFHRCTLCEPVRPGAGRRGRQLLATTAHGNSRQGLADYFQTPPM